MATRFSIFPSVAGDRFHIAADFLQRPAQETFAGEGDGVSREVGNAMAVVATSPETLGIDVSTGVARVDGWRFEVFTDPETLALSTADNTNDRIDRVVLRARTGSANRDVILDVLTGTPASSPVAPALTRSGDTYEMSLAQVLVQAQATSVSDTDVTDERGDNAVCGFLRAQDSELLQGMSPTDLGLEAGTRAFFQQSTAPMNWSKVTTGIDNRAIRVVTGNVGSGGSSGFSAALNSTRGTTTNGAHNHDGTNATTLSVSQTPSHRHDVTVDGSSQEANFDDGGGLIKAHNTRMGRRSANTDPVNITGTDHMDTSGGGGSHSHSISTDGGHSHTFNLDVQFIDTIVAIRNAA